MVGVLIEGETFAYVIAALFNAAAVAMIALCVVDYRARNRK